MVKKLAVILHFLFEPLEVRGGDKKKSSFKEI